MAKIVKTEALSVASSSSVAPPPEEKREDLLEKAEPNAIKDWRPKRLVGTLLGSIADSKEFDKRMEREAKRRRFFEAKTGLLPVFWSTL